MNIKNEEYYQKKKKRSWLLSHLHIFLCCSRCYHNIAAHVLCWVQHTAQGFFSTLSQPSPSSSQEMILRMPQLDRIRKNFHDERKKKKMKLEETLAHRDNQISTYDLNHARKMHP